MPTPPPESLEAVFALARAGDLGEARATCARWVEAHPDDAQGHWILGNLHGQGGRPAEARRALERAVALSPGEAAYHGDLGMACLAVADAEAAAAALARAVELAPNDADRRLGLAVALQRGGRQAEGVTELERCLQLEPDHPVALVSLGVARLDDGLADKALGLLARATAVTPDHGPAWRHYARCLLALNRQKEAEAALATARRLAPSDPDVRVSEAALARARDRLDEARARLEEAAALAPGRPDIEARLAELDGLEGRVEDGLARLGRLPATAPPAATAVARGRLAIQAGDAETAEATVEPLLALPALPTTARADLLAIRGDARARRGDHEGAVADWCASKALRPGSFDAEGFARLVDALVRAFPAGGSQEVTGDDGPLLIIGLPRAGKSLLEQVLASHPDVSGAGESSWLGDTVAALPATLGVDAGYPACVAALDEAGARRLGDEYRAHLASLAPPARWVATTLPGNLLHLGLLARIAPRARVIVMERDPLDTGVACLAKPFVDPALAWSRTPADIGRYLAGLQRLLAHWEAALALPVLRLRYEDLVANTEAVTRRALEFLDLPWNERCTRYHEAGVSRLGHSPVVRGPLDGRELGRGSAFAGALAPLVERLPAESHREP